MDPSIFRPLQARGQESNEQTAAVGRLTPVDSTVRRRQEEQGFDDVALLNKRVKDAHAAVAKLAILDPDDAQLAKAFIPPMRKRQASKVTVTTTTTIPAVGQCSSVALV